MLQVAELVETGIHHVTAIAGDPQANLAFYTAFLGLRLVKQTVNFGEPDTYHFYYGDESGHPGSLLTFFPFTLAAPGRVGKQHRGLLQCDPALGSPLRADHRSAPRRRRPCPQWRWDETVVSIRGKWMYLWRVADPVQLAGRFFVEPPGRNPTGDNHA